jgi:hypothetical protein
MKLWTRSRAFLELTALAAFLVTWTSKREGPFFVAFLLLTLAMLAAYFWPPRATHDRRRTDPRDEPYGPRVPLEEAIAATKRRFPAGGELVIAASPCALYDGPGSSRWILLSASEPAKWHEFWLSAAAGTARQLGVSRASLQLWQALREAGYETTWGQAVSAGHVYPAAQCSWVYVITVGPKPLRIWKRVAGDALTLVDFRDGFAKGSAFGGQVHRLGEIGPARIERRWAIDVCVVPTPAGEVRLAWRRWWVRPVGMALAYYGGALDPDPGKVAPEAPLEVFEHHINRGLGAGPS